MDQFFVLKIIGFLFFTQALYAASTFGNSQASRFTNAIRMLKRPEGRAPVGQHPATTGNRLMNSIYYIRNLRRLGAALRNTAILIRAPLAVRRLLRLRSELIAEIESLRPEIQSRLQPS